MGDRMLKNEKPPIVPIIILALGIFVGANGRLFAEVSQIPVASSAPATVVTSTAVAPPAEVKPAPVETKPAAVAPSGGLETIGAAACITCHESKNHFNDSVHARAFSQLKGIAFEQSCETCHGPGSLHAAAGGDKSNPGYATIKIFKGMSAVELGKTCLQCHQDENRMHWVGSVHEKRNVSCLACHSVHSAQEDKLLLVKPKVELVCAQCHKDIVAKIHRSEHMPLVEGKMDCTSCHNPHGSATPKLIKGDSANDTCYSCHADKRGPFVWEHPPVRENCMNCHDPHGSHHEFMLVARRPFLCQRCHDASRHPSTPYDNTYINKGGNRIIAEACTNCHSNIHGSNHPSGRYFTR
jgi:DmsE family decaheme c-type cytochrome